jgi:hypothetical protein
VAKYRKDKNWHGTRGVRAGRARGRLHVTGRTRKSRRAASFGGKDAIAGGAALALAGGAYAYRRHRKKTKSGASGRKRATGRRQRRDARGHFR